MPTIIKRKPAQSTRCSVSLLRTSLTLIESEHEAIVTIGMLTKNIHRRTGRWSKDRRDWADG